MIITLTGDRNWTDRDYIFNVLDDFVKLYGVTGVRCGCAKGADRILGWPCPSVAAKWSRKAPEPPEGWAASRGIPCDHYPANWDKYNKAAGPLRNNDMLEGRHDPCQNCLRPRHGMGQCLCIPLYPDVVLAFHPSLNESKGTKDMVTRSREAGVLVYTFPNPQVPFVFDFANTILWDVEHTGNAPNPEDMKLR
jgi:hypothetical protein